MEVFGYGGLRVDTYWGPHMVITPSFAVVGYGRGNGKDLGNPPVLGRFGIDFQYDLPDEIRLGVASTTCPMAKCSDSRAIRGPN